MKQAGQGKEKPLKAVTVQTDQVDSVQAGQELGNAIAQKMGSVPDAVLVFASSTHDYQALLTAVQDACRPAILIGCSSAGEFTSAGRGEGAACAFALQAPEMRFTAAVGRRLSENREAAAQDVVSSFNGLSDHQYGHRTAIVLADALAGFTDDLVEQLTRLTGGTYRFVGGGAGDDARFQQTHVFYGTEAITDAVVALEILSNKPIGIGVRHGWQPASDRMRVTEAEGVDLVSLNAIPAEEVIGEYAVATGQDFDRTAPVPFFLHNTLGIEVGDRYRLRVPLAVNDDGSLHCASDVPAGSLTRIMKTDTPSAAQAAEEAARDAVDQLGELEPEAALFFDCVATRLRIGNEFGNELAKVQGILGQAEYAGCNTYGQIARAEGQFGGFHNCTAVVCVFPK